MMPHIVRVLKSHIGWMDGLKRCCIVAKFHHTKCLLGGIRLNDYVITTCPKSLIGEFRIWFIFYHSSCVGQLLLNKGEIFLFEMGRKIFLLRI